MAVSYSNSPWTSVLGDSTVPKHPIYSQLSRLNGEVNSLPLDEVKRRLDKFGLALEGSKEILYKRLKTRLRRECISAEPSAPWDLKNQIQVNPYSLDYLCVLDFEATCEEPNPPDYIHEVIEFPVVLLNLRTMEVEDEFHQFCRPLLHPVLSDFCKSLTGISQAKVDSSPLFADVMLQFSKWLEDHELGSKYRFSLATDCPWDIKECLFPQCVLARVPFPAYATKWIDVRKMFSSFYQVGRNNLSSMLEGLGLEFEGREHSGIDDTRNIAKVITQIIKDGAVLKYNRFISNDVLQRFSVKTT